MSTKQKLVAVGVVFGGIMGPAIVLAVLLLMGLTCSGCSVLDVNMRHHTAFVGFYDSKGGFYTLENPPLKATDVPPTELAAIDATAKGMR